MSSSRGNTARKRPQKHQNRSAFRNDLHDSSHKTKFLNSLDVTGTGVCIHCKGVIEWKIKFKKYKALTAPKKCAGCEGKVIKYAYHVFCTKCAADKKVCPKCCQPKQMESNMPQQQKAVKSEEIEALLKKLPERKRRTIMRLIKKLPEDDQIPQDLVNVIQDLLSNVEDINDLDNFSNNEDDESD